MKRDNKRRFYYGYIVVLVASLILVVTQGTYFSFGVFFKPLSEEFGWTRAMTSGAFSLSMILTGFFFIFTGRLNDRFGPRFVMTVCGLFLGAGYYLMSQISALWQLYAFYGVMIAVGMSGGFIPLVSTVSRWFVKRRGLMVGIVSAGTGLGTLIVPPLANRLITSYDWRASYAIVGVTVVVIIVLASQFLRRDPSQVGQFPDGEQEEKREVTGSEGGGISLSEAIGTRQFWMFAAVGFCFAFSILLVMVHIVPHATDLGISPSKAAIIVAVIGGSGIIGRILMGVVGDRIGNKLAYATSLMLMTLAMALILAAKEMWSFYLFAAAFGFSYGGAATLGAPLVADLFGLRSHGAIMGSSTFWATTGGALGPLVAGYIFDVTGSYRLAFILSLILSVVALVLISLLRPTSKAARVENPIGSAMK